MKQVVLFVCTGNSCRSPMAAGLLKKYLKSRNDVEILSAGIAAMEHLHASPEAIKLMKHQEIDISQHRTRRLNKEMIEKATLILAMTKMHRMEILDMSPDAAGKVFLLKEFDQDVTQNFLDIPDPMGRPMADYENCLSKMKVPVRHLAENVFKPKKEMRQDDLK